VAVESGKPKKKRQVKNPETFRERALKANTAADKPKKTAKVRKGAGKAFSPFRTIGRGMKRIFGHKAFRWLRKPLRVLSRILLVSYFRSSWQELKKVTWPNFRQSVSLTFAVLIFAIVFGVVIAVVDFGLDKLFKDVLLK
jgi:preprotein translocase subunit SecE